jgi:acyl carrier protein
MTKDEVQGRLTPVFQDVFQNKALTIWDTMTAKDVAGWDSMNNIKLVLAIENEFSCKFTLREIGKQQNVGELMNLIIKKMS